VYLRAYDTVSEARTSIGSYLSFIIAKASFEPQRQTPDQVYFNRHACRSGVIDRWTMVARHARKEIATLWT